MIVIALELKGTQTKTHCSMTSSLGACEKLNRESERCRLYKRKLEYDWDAHAYKRCEECKMAERGGN